MPQGERFFYLPFEVRWFILIFNKTRAEMNDMNRQRKADLLLVMITAFWGVSIS